MNQLLNLEAHFSYLLARGISAFDGFLGSTSSLGLPIPLQAAAIPSRIASVVLHGLEFCISVPMAESALNRVQASWAKSLLGCRGAREGKWPIWVAERGWFRRLGTLMLERAILLKSRAQLLPLAHRVVRILSAASRSSTTWAYEVARIQHRPDFIRPIPDISIIWALTKSPPPALPEPSGGNVSGSTARRLSGQSCLPLMPMPFAMHVRLPIGHTMSFSPHWRPNFWSLTGDPPPGTSTRRGLWLRHWAVGHFRPSAQEGYLASLTSALAARCSLLVLNISLPLAQPLGSSTASGLIQLVMAANPLSACIGPSFVSNYLAIASASLRRALPQAQLVSFLSAVLSRWRWSARSRKTIPKKLKRSLLPLKRLLLSWCPDAFTRLG